MASLLNTKKKICQTHESSKVYVEVLREQLFQSADMNASDPKGDFGDHYYASNIRAETGFPSQSKMIRLVQEIGSLSTSLPLSEDSAIFVCCDDERLDVLKVLIIGPHPSTPYASGCFIFHIYVPNSYPQVPPMVHLETTGGGTVRFNPNLYNCGKVCLSLLGTWPGGQDEMWNPKISTILQVLISILGLIFVPEPYFNEPGYERSRGTPSGDEKNRVYNQTIRVATIQHAIVGQLRNPPSEFAEVIKTHFFLRKEMIIKQCEQWLEEAKPYKQHFEQLHKQHLAMLAEFEKLSKSQLIKDYEKEHGIEVGGTSSSSSSPTTTTTTANTTPTAEESQQQDQVVSSPPIAGNTAAATETATGAKEENDISR